VRRAGEFSAFHVAALRIDFQVPVHARRQNKNLLKRFNLIWAVQSGGEKYSAWRRPQISGFLSFVPFPQEGRFAIVTNVGSGMRWTRRVMDE
jgi:hypothetical protein